MEAPNRGVSLVEAPNRGVSLVGVPVEVFL